MTIKVLKSCIIHGHPGVKVGDVLDVPEHEARYLIQRRIAEPMTVCTPAPVAVEVREPEVENRDPVIEKQPKRTKKSLP